MRENKRHMRGKPLIGVSLGAVARFLFALLIQCVLHTLGQPKRKHRTARND